MMKHLGLILAALVAFVQPAFAQPAASSNLGPGDVPPQVLLGLANTWTAAQTFSAPVTVSSASFGLSGNITGAGIFGTSGIRYKNVVATLSDTTSSGTIATAYTDVWGGNTYTASNATTITNQYGSYFQTATCSTNVTCTNKWALGADSAQIAGVLNVTGAATVTTAGAASQAAVTLTGNAYTAGSATTNFPLYYINNGASGPTTFSANGTQFGINATSGFTGNFLDFHVNGGGSAFSVGSGGSLSTGGQIQVQSNGILIQNGGNAAVTANALIGWSASTTNASTSDTIITRKAAANFQLGAADAAAPVAQTLGVQNVVAGTTDTAGVNTTINASRGTGTGVGGNIIFQVAPHSTTGSTQNALTPILTLNGDNKLATFAGSINTTSVSNGSGGFNFNNGGGTNGYVQMDGNISSGTDFAIGSYTTLSGSSGIVNSEYIRPTINQSGTAGYTTLWINPTETATGSGAKNLILAQVGGTTEMSLSDTGVMQLAGVTAIRGFSNITSSDINSLGSASTGAITTSTNTGIPASGFIIEDTEIMAYTWTDSTHLNITARAQFGTSGNTHANSANIAYAVNLTYTTTSSNNATIVWSSGAITQGIPILGGNGIANGNAITASTSLGVCSSCSVYTGYVSSNQAGSTSNPIIGLGSSGNSGLYAVSNTGLGLTVGGTKRGDFGISTASQWTFTGSGFTLSDAGYASCTALTTNGSGVIGCTASDRRVKNDLGEIAPLSALARVMALPAVHKFSFKDGYGPAGEHYGWFAQDIQKVDPELVHKGPTTELTPDGELQFDKAETGPLALAAIKELQTEIVALKAEVAELKATVH